jgi:hypothetical protein
MLLKMLQGAVCSNTAPRYDSFQSEADYSVISVPFIPINCS